MLMDRLTPKAVESAESLLERYPPRNLPQGTRVTRVAPSPTGSMHIGGLYTALVSERVAHQSGGIFYLRIEDTDQAREVAGADELIVRSLVRYGILADEGEVAIGEERGAYGPYRQSRRLNIYHSFVRRLLADGKAYACFATPGDLEAIRAEQTRLKLRPGYYGSWAQWRDRPEHDVEEALSGGRPFVIRLRADGAPERRVTVTDLVRGSLSFPVNENDVVLLKSDGFPTYHLAHAVDDRLMGTTDVIRGHEWLGSLPVHLQLFRYFGWQPPRYAHISPIEKLDGASRRKLSKRSDPEASVSFYDELGYDPQVVIEYLLTLADSGFEDWRTRHAGQSYREFQLDLGRMNRSGALFDFQKLASIGRQVISAMGPDELFDRVVEWASQHDEELAAAMRGAADYAKQTLVIERVPGRERKDISKWSDVRAEIGYFFDEIFVQARPAMEEYYASATAETARLLNETADSYAQTSNRDEWLAWLRDLGSRYGYAATAKIYKGDPGSYKGHFGDVTEKVRVALTGRKQSPDLHAIMSIMGAPRVKRRLHDAAAMIST
jgi:glutamyl-tRNA synthetase